MAECSVQRASSPGECSLRVLVVAHGHPSLHKGGGEIAAYSLYKMLRESGDEAVFLGWGGRAESTSGGFISKVAENDYMLYSATEYFYFSSSSENLRKALELLTRRYDFDVVHFHHFIHVGIEAAAVMKQIKPSVRVVFTLHEYLGICANNGQLFKKSGVVCETPGPAQCVQCFPQRTEGDFFMRKLRIQAAFNFVDQFISPSEFLRQKYIEWGLDSKKIAAVENPLFLDQDQKPSPIEAPKSGEPWKLGFFGQINYYKGLDIILDGVEIAIRQGAKVKLYVHGKMSAVTGEDYIVGLREKMLSLSDHVVFHGPYDQVDTLELMGRYHFVILGSRWYENSPVVIQESFAAGRPIIYPGHGGMLEKIQKMGVPYKPGSSDSLAHCLFGLESIAYESLVGIVGRECPNINQSAFMNHQNIRNFYND